MWKNSLTHITQDGTGPVILNDMGPGLVGDATLKWRSRAWAFTLNNYTDDDITHITQLNNARMRVGKEVGDNGTPHLQGYIEFKNGTSFQSVKTHLGNNRVHIEPAHKCRNANLQYTAKGGEVIRDDFPVEYIYKGEDLPTHDKLYPWEISIQEMMKTKKASNREIIWLYDATGNSGKSTFGKYLEFHDKNVCYSRISKSNDILTAAEATYTTYYFDFPRSLGSDFCPFTALECILDGSVDDCKLKKTRRKLRFAPPWVIVASNHPPNRTRFSEDRWSIYSINKMKELEPFVLQYLRDEV